MALPSTGPLSFNQIRTELGTAQANSSLRSLSSCAGFSTPDAVSEFYGFSAGYTFTLCQSATNSLHSTGIKSGSTTIYSKIVDDCQSGYNTVVSCATINAPTNALTVSVLASGYYNMIEVEAFNNQVYYHDSANSYGFSAGFSNCAFNATDGLDIASFSSYSYY